MVCLANLDEEYAVAVRPSKRQGEDILRMCCQISRTRLGCGVARGGGGISSAAGDCGDRRMKTCLEYGGWEGGIACRIVLTVFFENLCHNSVAVNVFSIKQNQ